MADLMQALQVGGDVSSMGLIVFMWSMHHRIKVLEQVVLISK